MTREGTDQNAASRDAVGTGQTAEIGTIIDKRYRITGVLGEGGMGSVYRAEHIRLRRPVAIKLLHARFTQLDDVSKRFEREAFAAGRLDHPNCVNVSDFGELDDGTLYLVMELVDGVSLEDLIGREKRLTVARALHITRHVLRALGHAHQAGIVHRDVKPANVILVERDGDPEFARLLDFGIAKLVGEAASEEGGKKLTQAGVAFGTPLYLSPEQACGGRVDHRADLYSTSVMLFEMLTGVPPFDSETPLDILMMHATADVPRIAEVAPGAQVPDRVEALLRRGLAKKASERFTDAAEYLAEVERCQATTGTSPRENMSPSTEVLPSYTSTTLGVPPPPRAADQADTPAPVRTPVHTPLPTPVPSPDGAQTHVSAPSATDARTTQSSQQVAPLQAALTGAISQATRATSSVFGSAVRSLTSAPLPSAHPTQAHGAIPTPAPAAQQAPRRNMRRWWWIAGLGLLLLIIIASL